MDERENKTGEERIEAGEIKVKMPFSKWFENYWYHYKWHPIAAVFTVIVLCVLITQCATRPRYDVHILYAGDKAVSTSKTNPERQRFLNSFRLVSSDFDENGEVSVAFKHLYAPDAEEIARLTELEKVGKGEVPDSLIYEDKKVLDTMMISGEYYLLLLDRAVFDNYCARGVISSVEAHLSGSFSGEIVKGENGGSGVYLKDTEFYKLEGINTLPEDTVICIRMADAFATDSDLEKVGNAAAVLNKILGL